MAFLGWFSDDHTEIIGLGKSIMEMKSPPLHIMWGSTQIPITQLVIIISITWLRWYLPNALLYCFSLFYNLFFGSKSQSLAPTQRELLVSLSQGETQLTSCTRLLHKDLPFSLHHLLFCSFISSFLTPFVIFRYFLIFH